MLARESSSKCLVKLLQGYPDTEHVSSKKAFISFPISSRQIGTAEIKTRQVFFGETVLFLGPHVSSTSWRMVTLRQNTYVRLIGNVTAHAGYTIDTLHVCMSLSDMFTI